MPRETGRSRSTVGRLQGSEGKPVRSQLTCNADDSSKRDDGTSNGQATGAVNVKVSSSP